ncbi:Asparagine--tRNA ligase [Heracleum sosnowskyi]|uniref:asparagine--tRNA ligase n=1 Tax=Heracleum sosnowskyi TaxID=360622 RepID=A0AAD8MQT8_9APIA|nr:Asparagine--tRNA ligase [Heracleum sosnowskyi]
MESKVEQADFSQRLLIKNILKGGDSLAGQTVKVGGWVKNSRQCFLDVNDGSCLESIQFVVEPSLYPLADLKLTGTSVYAEGKLVMPPKTNTKQRIELKVSRILKVGTVDKDKYPLPKGKHSLEFIRTLPHLRLRTDTMSAVARIRNALAQATHQFFHRHDFLYIHTPIISTSDCEGAGEMFQVTTLFNNAEKLEMELIKNPPPSLADIQAASAIVKDKAAIVSQLEAKACSDEADEEQLSASISDLTLATQNLYKLEERSKLKTGIPLKDGKIDYAKDFFARQSYLTVSGQLHAETCVSALGNVYTFGPTFRAEHSHTSRHLAEFWMVEPEMAFATLEDDMRWAEAYVKFLCQWLLDNCLADMEFMADKYDKGAIDRLRMVVSKDFVRVSYTDAITILKEAPKKHKFKNEVKWGVDLASEHERYLTEVKYESPVIVHDYPKEIKAFYMKVNSDNKTVAAMDVIVPKVGELIGGSQREDCPEALRERMLELGMPLEPYEWYFDLRRYGTVEHSGFGLGFDRMVLFATGLDNIRDVIPFPRYPGRADL